MSENITEEINENIEEVKLTTPDSPETSNTPKIKTIWLVAKNRRVNRVVFYTGKHIQPAPTPYC